MASPQRMRLKSSHFEVHRAPYRHDSRAMKMGQVLLSLFAAFGLAYLSPFLSALLLPLAIDFGAISVPFRFRFAT